MSRRDDERVADILDAASEITEIIELGRDAWDKDRIRRLAVERLLEIIGEAANSLSEDFRTQHPGVPPNCAFVSDGPGDVVTAPPGDLPQRWQGLRLRPTASSRSRRPRPPSRPRPGWSWPNWTAPRSRPRARTTGRGLVRSAARRPGTAGFTPAGARPDSRP